MLASASAFAKYNGSMKFVLPLTDVNKEALMALHRSGATHRQRQRAQAVLLSAKNYSLDQIADVIEVDRETISRWLDLWQDRGLTGLIDAPKSGRPRKIDPVLELHLRDLIQNPSPDLKALVQADLQKRGSVSVGIPSDAPFDNGDIPSEEHAVFLPKPQILLPKSEPDAL